MRNRLFSHFFGSLAFGVILLTAVFLDNLDRFPEVVSYLPARRVGVARQPVRVYECENFGERNLVKEVETGDSMEIEYVACGSDTRWGVKLADGREGCYSASDESKVTQKDHYFRYF